MALLALEPLLLARIEAAMPVANLKVLSAADLDGVTEAAQHSPAVHVVPYGLRLVEQGTLITPVETWLTVLAVRNVRSQQSGRDARGDAAALLDTLFAALHGWQGEINGQRLKPLRPVTPPRAGFRAGFGYFPLAWEAQLPALVAPCSTY